MGMAGGRSTGFPASKVKTRSREVIMVAYNDGQRQADAQVNQKGFCRRLMVAMTGAPQCGHVRA
jgi:hypothetical protein